ncbi:hypothetical protein [Klebsiella grimontii]|uniref:hypothetical protein n=1 Tax=Klebsiella grimontii TaxID=2058152 RepID=UPI001E2F4EB5|nr:hypothetical protein [Klebsiella grimontii]
MTSKFTREELLNIIETDHVQCGEASALARMALAAMDSEPNRNPVLAYADSYRDMEKQGVESVPIWSVITDLERNIAPLYRHAQQPVVPDNTQHFDTIALETAEEIMCDVNRRHEFLGGEIQLLSRIQCRIDDACRAAMLQESQKSAGESNNCRSCENVQDLQAGNSPVITGAEQRIADAVELLKKAAPAMLADNSGPNGPLAGRLKSPVIPEGYVMVPKEPTERMVIDGFESEPDETFSEPEVWEAFQKMSGCEKAAFRARLCWAAMIAAAL